MNTKIYLLVSLSLISSSVLAMEKITGKVTILEPTYLPGSISFQLDSGTSTCPSGNWLKWKNSDPENNKAVYSTLMTALVTGKDVVFYIADGDSSCVGRYLHLKAESDDV